MVDIQLSQDELTDIKMKCQEAILNITWRRNADPADCTTVTRALQLARNGFDGGPTALDQLQPNTNSFEEWMNFVHLVTVYYNHDKKLKKFTILRKRITL